MEKLLFISSHTEPRDKFLKFIQYTGILVKDILPSQLSVPMLNLSKQARSARKIFRIGNSLYSILKILSTYKNSQLDTTGKILRISTYINLTLRWFFDNLYILSAYRILSFDQKNCIKLSTFFWFIALIFNLLHSARQMMQSYARQSTIKQEALGRTTHWVVQNLEKLSLTRRLMVFQIARTIGDMIIASNSAQIPYKILGKHFSNKWVGIGGLVASFVSLYQLLVQT